MAGPTPEADLSCQDVTQKLYFSSAGMRGSAPVGLGPGAGNLGEAVAPATFPCLQVSPGAGC